MDSKKPTEKFEAGIPAANESRDCVVLVKVGVTDLGLLGLGIGWTGFRNCEFDLGLS